MPNLYVTGLPIDAQWRKLDPRVVEIVGSCDLLIAEERKNAIRLLVACGCRDKEFILINEHSQQADRQKALEKILNVETSVLVSDAGTPCVADPDFELVDMCHKRGVSIFAVPGASSIISALSVSGFYAGQFIYLGFPPKSGEPRSRFFKQLSELTVTAVFMERPYALKYTLQDMSFIKKDICLCINSGWGLSPEDKGEKEIVIRGKAAELAVKVGHIKSAFTIVVNKC